MAGEAVGCVEAPAVWAGAMRREWRYWSVLIVLRTARDLYVGFAIVVLGAARWLDAHPFRLH